MRLSWKKITLLLCLFGFLKEVRPVTPFLTAYLTSVKHFTNIQLYSSVYPFWSYSSLVCLVPVFIFTDLLRYKPVILLESLFYILTWVVLIWGSGLAQMQLMQCFYGLATSCEIAYFSYIYAVVDQKHYLRVTSFVRSAVLAGRSSSYAVAQIVISTGLAGYQVLNYLTFGCLLCVFLIAIGLPSVSNEEDVAEEGEIETLAPENEQLSSINEHSGQSSFARLQLYFRGQVVKFKLNYSNPFVLKWSIWWALATCGYCQIGNFIQNLWYEVRVSEEYTMNEGIGNTTNSTATSAVQNIKIYNGVTEAVNTLLGALVAFGVQLLRVNWIYTGEMSLGVLSFLDALLLILLALGRSLYAAYAFYIIYCTLYQMVITIATYNVARMIEKGSQGLVFGCNTFVALLFQTILTIAVADSSGSNLPIRDQFLVYGGVHVCLAVAFLVMGINTVCRTGVTERYIFIASEKGVNNPPESATKSVEEDNPH